MKINLRGYFFHGKLHFFLYYIFYCLNGSSLSFFSVPIFIRSDNKKTKVSGALEFASSDQLSIKPKLISSEIYLIKLISCFIPFIPYPVEIRVKADGIG
jgi:hypothetical protein